MQEQTLKLHDIKPLVAIDDYSFFYFLIVSIVGIVIIVGAVYLLLKWLKNRKKENIRKKHLKLLQQINLKDTKKAAYMLTKYGATFKDDDQRHQEMYANMLEKLADYKYKKSVKSFDKETISVINLYREMCDV
jgi:N-acetyl-anhydromuramyl-L-alanine amidase AmpD